MANVNDLDAKITREIVTAEDTRTLEERVYGCLPGDGSSLSVDEIYREILRSEGKEYDDPSVYKRIWGLLNTTYARKKVRKVGHGLYAKV